MSDGGFTILNKRQEWMVTKLSQCFDVSVEVAEKCIRDNKKKVDTFLIDVKSPPKLFFFYQPRQFKVAELFLSVGGEGEKLEGKCLYFIRDSGAKAVNVKVGQDHTVLAGELTADILNTFQTTLEQVYKPLLKQQPTWGEIKREKERKYFLDHLSKFEEELKRKIANLRGDVELRTPAPPFDKIEQKPASYAKAAKDKAVLTHFQDIVTSWCEQITKYLEDDQSNTPIQPNNESGPDVEIEYWCRRMLTLISITEQLKSKPNRVVTGVLKARALRNDESGAGIDGKGDGEVGMGMSSPMSSGGSSTVGSALGEQDQIKNLIERWREVDLAITDALNEAKDNVRFLDNLRKVIEPLYTESPSAIADTMPALMNSMKMIHTLSRHYGTETRMTNLFQRITNQLITRCKEDIYGGESVPALWQQDPAVIIGKMNAAISLLDEYRRQYKDTKARLATMPKGKQFNFDETAIFGKFVRFRRRLEKLIDMFSSIQQFKALERKRIDGMDELIHSFDTLVNEFKLKGHDLLDFSNTVFERDFVEFTMHNSGLENAIQDFMERSLTQMASIDKQLDLMTKFAQVLARESLKEDLEHKYLMIFKLYGEELHTIQSIYEKHKDAPPIPRNMTRIAGNIHWSRQLLRRITSPMKKFQENPKVFFPRDSKKIVRHYNKLARTLIEFESLWFQAWERSTDSAKKGLRAKLIVAEANPTNATQPKLYVNFDHGVLQLMREAKHLSLMGFDIPNSARVVLLLEEKLKSYYNHISYALQCYNKITAAVPTVCRSLLKPHLLDLEKALAPAMTTMTWTSMNIDSFISSLHTTLARFEYLVSQINDIIHNRVEKNLQLVSNMALLHIPIGRTFTLRDFVAMQRAHLESCTEVLLAKNEEIERAVDDLIDAVLLYPLDPSIPKVSAFDVNLVKLHYCHLMFHSLLAATKRSLNDLKKRVRESGSDVADGAAVVAAGADGSADKHKSVKVSGDDDGSAVVPVSTALFEVDLSLQVPKVTLSPSLDEVQDAINAVARDVLQCTRKIIDWGIDPTSTSGKRPRRSFYDRLASDKNLAIVLLLLTGAVEDTKIRAVAHLSKYDQYAWLWQKDPESAYREFVTSQSPILEDLIQELHKFVAIEGEINDFPSAEQLGCLHLKTEQLKAAFKHETERWKFQYSEKLHQEAKNDMDSITEQMADLKSKLERDVKDFASLKFVMDAQAEIRDVQSWIDIKFDSIIERYNTLEKYLPFGAMTKDEMDAKSVLRTQWQSILSMSGQVMSNVNGLQGGFKQDLLDNVKLFKQDVKRFRQDYELNGPMARSMDPNDPNGKSIPPLEAMTRLNKYKREFETLNRKYELFNGGEKLFGLPEQKYPDLVKTRKELRLLDQLYTLYQQVISTVDEYKAIPWSEVMANIQTMNETVEGFNQRCRHLPRGLKSWEAYLELSQTIEDFIEILPLLTELSKPAMRDRHWKKISKLTGKEFELEKFHELKLRSVLEANLLEYREDIEEITDGAEKQLAIERKILEIQALWDVQQFEFAGWKDRGDVILSGAAVADIIEQLEDSQASLIQMLTQRHVTPFRDVANSWLKKLSDVNDTLESWVKVQMIWMALESVFTGGDIARQMPQDTRVFMKVDKEWTTRLMNKAKDVKNVVECCQNEYIKNMLPTMFADLEKCQKALDGYLEQKRLKFPRFYFVSNPALLLILSQGSDKDAVQQCFAKVFDAIDRVEFQGANIVKIRSQSPGHDSEMDHEDIQLSKPVPAKGNIEDWLNQLLKEMRRSMKDIVRAGANDFEAMQWSDFIAKYCAQVALLGVQFMWTSDVQEALIRTKHDKSALSAAFKKQTAVLTELSSMTTQDIKTKLDRTKIETLVTIQVHQRDVLADLMPRGSNKGERRVKDVYDFEWQRQLRCYWVPEDDECVVKVADVDTPYCYEYLGCKERLVVTPLTDRAYVSLSQAVSMCFGGAPAGPAGTGKTETTKDLGRAYGKYVVVFNCSDQMHTADTAKIYKGLCQSGSWGCFDEFNRIDLEVLSVVAQQVQAVLGAVRARAETFVFPGDDTGEVQLDDRCGFFITMNPGYAGRQELPENLKAMFRSCAMMIPDREIIIKVKLASVGYLDFAVLSKKFRVLYNLCEEQLSKQRHYDFGLRNILSVLRTAGVNLRLELLKDSQQDRSNLEEMLMMRTLRDMNLSKLVADDVDLFISLLHDLFPNQRDPEKRRYDAEEEAMRQVIDEMKLIHHDTWVGKIVQLFETSLVRHGLMMVGPAGSGKSMATKVLIESLTLSHDRHLLIKMNPKAIKAEEMFGQNDVISGEWTHGIFSSIWQKYNDPNRHHTWIVCDGPVDAIWIENLNSVLDDNKLLTLANGDRLPMTDNVRLLFEVQDLRNASPATVSRAGIIFVSSSDLGTEPVVQAWLNSRREDEAALIKQLYNKYIYAPPQVDLYNWLRRSVSNVMNVSDVHMATNLFHLLEGLLHDPENEQRVYKQDELERLFLYCVIWSMGALLEADDRLKFSDYLAQIAGLNFPAMEDGFSLYDFYVNDETLQWEHWEAPEWEFVAEKFNFSTCLVPTVDSIRAEFLIDTLMEKMHRPVLVVGSSGTAKTSLVLQYTNGFDNSKMLLKKVNFSSATTPGMFQTSIEADVEKRQGKTFAPAGGRMMTVFLDDISMPEVNKWGDQPTLELVRQLIETNGFYFLEKDKRGDKKILENILYVGAMSHPGGGRNDIPDRLKRHFFTFNLTPPSQASIDNIYGSMLRGRFEDVPQLAQHVPAITAATIELWLSVKARMLPTPSKFHYIFNMRELSRVFQGVLFSPLDVVSKGHTLIALWTHECFRVFSDKLTNAKDKKWFEDNLWRITAARFGDGLADELRSVKEPIYFVDFLRDEIIDEDTDEVLEDAPKIYERVPSVAGLHQRVDDYLAKYNTQTGPGVKHMNLVMFDDALEHLMRISRIIAMPRGNALLVGVGGSGRQSLARLAAYIARQDVFQITITRTYKLADFLDDLRKMYVSVGKEGRKLTWILTDFDIVNEEFLEYVNAILTTGEVAGLFPKDERDMMCSDLRGPARKENPDFIDTPDNLYKYFIDRIRDNLHIVLCFSPANEKFAERARRFPGIVSSTTIDWFLKWGTNALLAVASRFVSEDPKGFKVECDSKVERKLVTHIASVHDLVTDACEEYFQKYRRPVFVTPKSYLAFISSYKQVYTSKLAQITLQQKNVEMGLKKLKEAEVDVVRLQEVLAHQNVELGVAEKAATAMLAKLEVGAKEADIKKSAADAIELKCTRTANQIAEEQAQANTELEQAMPYVRAAEKAARSINKKDLTVIQKLGKPPDLIKRIMDCVLILCHRPLDKVSVTEIKVGKNEHQLFVMDSYDTFAKKMMVEPGFLNLLLDFASKEKDNINEETMELLEPYLKVSDFHPERARTVSSAAEGLCKWVMAMASYHEASLVVGPKLEQLKIKSMMFEAASIKLKQAKAASKAAQDEVDRLQEQFTTTMREKAALEEQAKSTQEKMVAANNLIRSLAGEKKRWQADALIFAEDKKKLVGNCALACAFVSYLGPFNHEFRKKLLDSYFYKDCQANGIPVSKDLDLTNFLVDAGTIAEWNSQSLPKDDLSIQNGILVTQASRYPLLVDPQGQALAWLKRREANDMPIFGTTTITNPKIRDQLEFCMENGKPLIVEGVTKEVDPAFDPVLEKNLITRGRTHYIMLGEKQVQFDPAFRLYLITKLSNPKFSPELCAKTTIIDFSVTQKGLEEQLLSRVIQQEQKSLEEQRQKLIEEVNANTISLQALDKQLLERLSASQGNLLDDTTLIGVLADTKTKAQEVKEKIEASVATEQIINKRREHYRPVATRGSVIYFVIVAMAAVNPMYQSSLAQFLQWFDQSLLDAEKANLVAKRVDNLMKHLTFEVYININRGLFEQDKLLFKLMATLKILETDPDSFLDSNMITLLLRGGAALSLDMVPRKPFDWLQMNAWFNICQLSQSLDFFGDLKNAVEQNEAEWKKWYEAEAPETLPVPRLEDRLAAHPSGEFMRLLIVRSFRDDRTRLAANTFIGSVLGERYIDPAPARLDEIHAVSNNKTPIILLLTPGADPTSQLEELAKKKGVKIYAVSMGEGQEPYARRSMEQGMDEGAWSLLSNCHLGLAFMGKIEEDLIKYHEEKNVSPDFRLWITCEPHVDFPINLLQISIKMTNEPPRGMKAGLLRSYTSVVDSERLGRVETKEWRDIVFTLCFLHSVVQERRKFGPVGWSIPYEFNTSDLEASLSFLEKHAFSNQGLSWPTVRYMICEVQYGGRITDDFDRILFNTFGKEWLGPDIFKEEFAFTRHASSKVVKYTIPACETIEAYRTHISELPSHDSPELFGLHVNADLTFGTNEALYILNTISETQPKETGIVKGGKTREETVYDKADELLALMPKAYKDDEVRESIRKRSKLENEFVLGYKPEERIDGFSIPLNIFLYQEITRLNRTIGNVRQTLLDLKSAINGEIIMTPELQAALDDVFNEKPPKHWYVDASGSAIAWYLPSLALWFAGLIDREKQLTQWLNHTRPTSYWLTGFFNPQGFLTATRQEVTRRHKNEKWALDDVVLVSTVTDHLDLRRLKMPPSEGVYIHGLFLEGCSWDRKDGKMIESHPKELFTPMPVILVTAVTSKAAERQYAIKDDIKYFDCPVYRQPKRTDLAYIFTIKLKTYQDPDHWILRGVALLCSKD